MKLALFIACLLSWLIECDESEAQVSPSTSPFLHLRRRGKREAAGRGRDSNNGGGGDVVLEELEEKLRVLSGELMKMQKIALGKVP